MVVAMMEFSRKGRGRARWWVRDSGGQSREPCPICHRAPGGVHDDICPRSKKSHLALDEHMADLGQSRLLWTKGMMGIRKPSRWFGKGKTEWIHNPGLPYVRPGRNWTAGGFPRGKEAEVRAFIKELTKK
jgi:hypothetical protein